MRKNDHASKTAAPPDVRKVRKNLTARRILQIGMPKIQYLFMIAILSVIFVSGLILLTAGNIFNETKEAVSEELPADSQSVSKLSDASDQSTYDHKSSKETEIPGTFKTFSSTAESAVKQTKDSSDVLSAYIPPEDASAADMTSADIASADVTTADPSSADPSTAAPAAGSANSAASATSAPSDVSEAGERFVVPFFYVGDPFGTLSIPSAGINVNVYQGDSEDEFQLGAGHYCGSLFPGQGGNIVIASHCTTYFRNFEYLKIGDEVKIETVYGRFTYQIQEIRIIDSDFDSIVEETDQERLTMYTCYPFTGGTERTSRYVVIGDLIESAFT